MANALVHDAEAQRVAVGSSAVSRERAHAFHRARFGSHIVLCCRALHAFAQRAVDTCHGQGGQQVAVDGVVGVSVAQQAAQQLRCDVIIKRESRAVGHLVVRGVKPQLPHQVVHCRCRLLARGAGLAAVSGYLVEHRLRHGVVAALHHGQ